VLYGGAGAALSGDALMHLTKPRRQVEPQTIDIAVAPDSKVVARDFFRPHR
jgi:hypothetical protein